MEKIKVLVVDDSALMRKLISEILMSDNKIEVVGTARDAYVAKEKIQKLNPDVLTLDVEMPKMDGLTFLEKLMRLHPMPVVMISSLTEKGADVTLDALALGAVDFVAKPKLDLSASFESCANEIIEKVKIASASRVRRLNRAPQKVDSSLSADVILEKTAGRKHFKTTDTIIALGASTGGTEAIREVLEGMPASSPAIVITQHIPAQFSAPFAERMNKISKMTVKEAQDGDTILPGHVYIAPGDQHLLVVRDGARYQCKLSNGDPVNRHKPSVDVLFRSVAQNVGSNAVGVILTGMGKDGALGMNEMNGAGAVTIAQDEKSSVVWGMPGEAIRINAVTYIEPLKLVANRILVSAADSGKALSPKKVATRVS